MKTVPFLEKACFPDSGVLRTHALHQKYTEHLDNGGLVSEVFLRQPSDKEHRSFWNNSSRLVAKQALAFTQYKKKADDLFAEAADEGTFDNVITELSRAVGQLYAMSEEYHNITKAFRRSTGETAFSRMCQEKRVLLVSDLDKIVLNTTKVNFKPSFEQPNFAVVYNSLDKRKSKAYGLYRKITVKPNNRAKVTMGRIYGPAKTVREQTGEILGDKFPILHINTMKSIPYFMRRHFYENVRLSPKLKN